MGRDQGSCRRPAKAAYFNPRAPCGARRPPCPLCPAGPYFNPRAPCGARRTARRAILAVRGFQSTRPVWGATRRSSTAGASSLFQSTRPVWGATFLRSIGAKRCTKFQSTRPVWGATGGDQLFDLCGTISIHAPRVGRDAIRPRCRSKMPYFNPRAPCGARLHGLIVLLPKLVISIHAPRVGRDRFARPEQPLSAVYFNPRAPCGARP